VDERIYQIALSLLSGIGSVKAKLLAQHYPELEFLFKDKHIHKLSIEGIGRDTLLNLNAEQAIIRAQEELEFIEANDVSHYYYKDPNFPQALNETYDGPLNLFTLGKVDFKPKNVAIVGTRKSTIYGKKMTDQLVEGLANYPIQIVSGLAHGIDKFAHEAALRNGLSTIGVLGHGLDTLYPAAHRALARQMLEQGGLVTEFVSGVIGDPQNFPRRNRIVAGLCEATVVVESSESGGSMITANLANDYNREVFAFPGFADKESSKGCNNLIKRGKAHLISSADDLIESLQLKESSDKAEHEIQAILDDLNAEESRIIDHLKTHGATLLDELSNRLGFSIADLSLHTFNLQMKDLVVSLAGNRIDLK